MACWGFAVVYQLMRCLVGWFFLRRLRREAVEVIGATADLFAQCREELQVRSAVRLTTHPRVLSPILFGMWRPMIVVPVDWPQRALETRAPACCMSWPTSADSITGSFLFWRQYGSLFSFIRSSAGCWHVWNTNGNCCAMRWSCVGESIRAYARLLVELARASGRLAWPAVSLPMGRRRTVKGRIHHLLEEDMERYIRPLSLRWTVVLGCGLLALTLGLASYRVLAVEKEQEIAAETAEKAKSDEKKTEKQPAPSPPAAPAKREALRYGGENFYAWQKKLLTELKPSIRIDGLTALAAFGENGYGAEATQAVIEMMCGYDPALEDTHEDDAPVVNAGFRAIRKIGTAAVPTLTAAIKEDNRYARRFAIMSLRRFGSDARPACPPCSRRSKATIQ